MNEILAVLYYCFLSYSDEIIPTKYLESDLFFCFNQLMTDIRDGFLRELDKEDSGITGKLNHYSKILKVVNPKIYKNLKDENVNH